MAMTVRYEGRESRLRAALPTVLLVAFVWAGLQILLLIYLKVVILFPTSPFPSAGEFRAGLLSGAPGPGETLALGLLVVNVLFVGLIWLRYASAPPLSRPQGLAALVTHAGVTLLLGFLQWRWLQLLAVVFGGAA